MIERSFDGRFLLEWTLHGRAVRMHPNFEAELARIRQQSPAGTDPGPAWDRLPIGTAVTLDVVGQYAGGHRHDRRARPQSIYHVRTSLGVLMVPFALVRVVDD